MDKWGYIKSSAWNMAGSTLLGYQVGVLYHCKGVWDSANLLPDRRIASLLTAVKHKHTCVVMRTWLCRTLCSSKHLRRHVSIAIFQISYRGYFCLKVKNVVKLTRFSLPFTRWEKNCCLFSCMFRLKFPSNVLAPKPFFCLLPPRIHHFLFSRTTFTSAHKSSNTD